MAFQFGTNIQLDSQLPLDVRTVVANQTALNNLVTSAKAYAGLLVYVTTENKYYYYNGSIWVELTIGTGGGSANLDFTVISSNFTALINTKIGADTTVSSFTLTLPNNPTAGDIVEIIDINNTFHINNLIINPNGKALESQNGNLTCNIKGAHFVLVFYNNNWEISILNNEYDKTGIIKDENRFEPLIFLRINVPEGVPPTSLGLFNSLNAQNYKICWTDVEWYNPELVSLSETIDNSKLLTYNSVNKNIYVREPGLYNVDMRYASFDLLDPNAFLRIRLRSSSNPIQGGLSQNNSIPDGTPGVNVLSAFAQSPIGTSFNGEAMVAGVSNFILAPSQVPIYLAADFLHTLGPVGGAFPVFDDEYGVRPFLLMSRVSTL